MNSFDGMLALRLWFALTGHCHTATDTWNHRKRCKTNPRSNYDGIEARKHRLNGQGRVHTVEMQHRERDRRRALIERLDDDTEP